MALQFILNVLCICTYIRFASIIKPRDFYERHAAVPKRPLRAKTAATKGVSATTLHHVNHRWQERCYFYNIDWHGRLYLEETMPKNIVTSIKDVRFLDFFFSRIMYVNDLQVEYMILHDIPVYDYPFISTCGKEWNFIRPVATPMVFHTLVDRDQDLLYGSTDQSMLREPFNEVDGIALSKKTGKLYHKLTTHSYYPLARKKPRSKQAPEPVPEYALLGTSLASTLSDRIVVLSDDAHGQKRDDDSDDMLDPYPPRNPKVLARSSATGLGFIMSNGRTTPIFHLPPSAEPGPWSMPHDDGTK
jgi:Domain of unknown function (DUF4505)